VLGNRGVNQISKNKKQKSKKQINHNFENFKIQTVIKIEFLNFEII